MRSGFGAAIAALMLVSVAVVTLVNRPRSVSERGAVVAGPPRAVVDSSLPMPELLRRFRAGLDSTVTLDGPRSRDELVRRFLDGVRRRDTAAVRRLELTRAEYAWLVFPELAIARPPYSQPPAVDWMLRTASSDEGLRRLMLRAERLELRGYRCPRERIPEGRVTLWRGCVVRVAESGHERDLRLFDTIVERDGRFKFRGFDNGF